MLEALIFDGFLMPDRCHIFPFGEIVILSGLGVDFGAIWDDFWEGFGVPGGIDYLMFLGWISGGTRS